MPEGKLLEQDGPLGPLFQVVRQLDDAVDLLRTMHLQPGDAEPVDCEGRDLCGRVREMAHLCRQLNEELELISERINDDVLT